MGSDAVHYYVYRRHFTSSTDVYCDVSWVLLRKYLDNVLLSYKVFVKYATTCCGSCKRWCDTVAGFQSNKVQVC